jgi:hypothetical protein
LISGQVKRQLQLIVQIRMIFQVEFPNDQILHLKCLGFYPEMPIKDLKSDRSQGAIEQWIEVGGYLR